MRKERFAGRKCGFGIAIVHHPRIEINYHYIEKVQADPRCKSVDIERFIDACALLVGDEFSCGKKSDAVKNYSRKCKEHCERISPGCDIYCSVREPVQAAAVSCIAVDHQPVARTEAQAAQHSADE